MAKDLDPIALSKKLLLIYARYLQNPADRGNADEALLIHQEYLWATDLLDARLARAIDVAVDVGFPRPPGLSTKEAQTIIEGLRELISENSR